MSERGVIINVTSEFRAKIKALKHELTYEQYFTNLLEKERSPEDQSSPLAQITKPTKERRS